MKTTKRLRTPTVMQMEAVECGAAALSMILGYYKRFVPLEELRIACGVSTDGVNALNLLEAGRNYGLEANAYKLSFEELAEVPRPCVLFWDFNHFVVLEGFSSKGVWINDPEVGPKRVSYEKFSRSYTGLALTFAPTEKFKTGGTSPSAVEALKRRLKGIYLPFIYLAITQFCLIIPVLATAAFSRIFIDRIVMGHHLDWKWGLIFAMLVALFLQASLTWFQGKCLYRLNAFLSIRLSSNFLRHILRLPMDYYHQRTSGDLAWRVQLNDVVINTITTQIARAALNLLQVVVYVIVMFSYSWIITLIAIFEASLNALMLLWINRTRQDAMSKVVQNYLMMTGFSVGGIQNMETIKSLGMENDFFSKWAGFNSKWLMSNQSFGVRNIVLTTLVPFFRMMTTASLIGVGAYLILQGQMTVGMLIALHIILQHFLEPLNELVGLGKTIQEVKINLLRLDDTTKNPIDEIFAGQERDRKGEEELKLNGNLEVKDLYFGYNPTKPPIIQDFHLSLSSGKSIAIVGGSSSGKSTIAGLVSGLYHPTQGEILYDNKKRDSIFPIAFHNSVSIVNQQILLFSGSIKENITLWNNTIPENIIFQAAKDALIHDEILARKQGYDHQIEEGGADLSGGERQRLEIARALVKNPSLLIMDEATSSLDAATEAAIVRNVKRRGCACLIIAHRLSTIRDCDEIIVLDHGKTIQRGTHEVLKDEDGPYKTLVCLEGVK